MRVAFWVLLTALLGAAALPTQAAEPVTTPAPAPATATAVTPVQTVDLPATSTSYTRAELNKAWRVKWLEKRKELVAWVRKEIGPIATPDVIQWAPGLPKTRSGKIMRRILRKIGEGDVSNLGDTSTLADPSVVDNLLANRPHSTPA